MKKRIISLLLALIMALSLLPVSVLAADDHTGQVHVTVENTTWAEADGAPWEGMLVDEWVTLQDDSSMMSCIVDALTAGGLFPDRCGHRLHQRDQRHRGEGRRRGLRLDGHPQRLVHQ